MIVGRVASNALLIVTRVLAWLASLTRSRVALNAEVLILGDEVAVLRRASLKPRLDRTDRALLTALFRLLPADPSRHRLVSPEHGCVGISC